MRLAALERVRRPCRSRARDRRISSTATAESSQTARSRSTNRLSIHGSGNVTPGASHPSSVVLDCVDLDLLIWLCRRLRGGVGGRL
jgi:hypothetical protein